MKKILIVEDDREIAELERDYLEASEFEVTIEEDGLRGQDAALHGGFDLVILDLMLPHIDGFNLCRRLRMKLDIPVIIVSARQTDIDKIRGFGLGADDYMTKPFSPGELVARVKAHLTRYEQLKGTSRAGMKPLTYRELVLEPGSRRVFCQQQEVHLTNREFELLQFFMENPGIVFSRERLFERIWGVDAIGDSATVAVHINRIREKIEQDPAHPCYIETVRGAGYRFHKD
ncbi:response regulator transcription factor [Mitsuokella sp.]|uniref:response regulator transcription factor n=1 Tax=Mitsuokella TaxID=52225 RepID=UPI0029E10B9E|nr:response regulator transcription factor [Mitsuokella sp.]MDD6382194.1 response regulator transcription factor [Selenomonadaceae bacterium]MDY4474955.1 response regulator transcription factor [Mitsuokella sp.]